MPFRFGVQGVWSWLGSELSELLVVGNCGGRARSGTCWGLEVERPRSSKDIGVYRLSVVRVVKPRGRVWERKRFNAERVLVSEEEIWSILSLAQSNYCTHII